MKIIGITGGIGSGKSVVCRVFSHLGIPVYEADAAAKILYEKYPELKESIRNRISAEAIDSKGNVNRKRLSEIIFNDEEKLKTLNAIVHPLVQWDFANWTETHKGFPYLIKEAAILFESGSDAACDLVATVVSPAELRFSRLRERDRKTKQEVEAIMARQMSDDERIRRSHGVIYNDEKQMIIPQVLRIHDAVLKNNLSSFVVPS